MPKYIHQLPNWPEFFWDAHRIMPVLAEIRNKQGKLLGFMSHVGLSQRNEATLNTLTLDVLKSSEIEGEILNVDQVRSSVARRLGLELAGLISSDRNVDGIVDMMLDATQHYKQKLTSERLFSWHAALFPTGRSGMYKITVGNWRNNEKGPMQVVSGAMGKEKIHFEAPDAVSLEKEMDVFLNWFNEDNNLDALLKAAIAHLWFITIHPFDDGNGRIARAISDMQLSKADDDRFRFYSVSAQIRLLRKKYYDILESTQKGSLDITDWIIWFLQCVENALNATELTLTSIAKKTNFWHQHSNTIINERQRHMLNLLFDGFEGNLTSTKWAKIMKCSPDTALRDINDLIEKNILQKSSSGGRTTQYLLKN